MSHYGYIVHSELAHHGIKGMKWGIRKYQNPDGTLTEAGKKRYGSVQGLNRAISKRKRIIKTALIAAAATGAAIGAKKIIKKAANGKVSEKNIKKRINDSLKDDQKFNYDKFEYDRFEPELFDYDKFDSAINSKDSFTKFKFANDNNLGNSVKDYMINQDDYGNKKKTLKFD